MASERERVSSLATWVGGQVRTLRAGVAMLRAGSTPALTPKLYTASGTTTTGGAVSFTLPTGYFSTIVYAGLTPVRDTATVTAATFATVRTRTTGAVTGQVWESKTTTVVVLNTSIEGIEASGAGITVDLYVVGY